MSAGQLENGSSIRKVIDTLALCKKLIPSLGCETADALLRKDVERLALSAPHMLSDIGFKRDTEASSTECAVWARGDMTVRIATLSRVVTIADT